MVTDADATAIAQFPEWSGTATKHEQALSRSMCAVSSSVRVGVGVGVQQALDGATTQHFCSVAGSEAHLHVEKRTPDGKSQPGSIKSRRIQVRSMISCRYGHPIGGVRAMGQV
jgi:hypothetical protein